MKIITKRKATIIRDLPSARLTLTNELIDIGIDIEKESQDVWVSVAEDNSGRKMIVIKK